LVAGGKVTAYDGDLESYAASVTDSAPAREKSNSRKQDKKARTEKTSATAPLRQAVKDAELRLAKLAAEQKLWKTS